MYFTKYHPLKERLRDRMMDDREALPYFVVYSVLAAIATSLHAAPPPTVWLVSNCAGTVLVTLAGVLYCYRQNGGQAGYDFIQKSVVLGWVVAIRLIPLFLLSVLAGRLLKSFLGHPKEEFSWVDVVLDLLTLAFYFERLGRHLRDTNKQPFHLHAPPPGAP
jgi:uncharacterized membrane protein YadS